jgi:serine/threonine-protein kinase
MATSDAAPVREGDILAGKYRVEKVLGAGGMGVVVAARHTQLGQRVAIKFLLPEVCERPEAVRRFLREAQAAVQIQSEHVARVLDVGTLETGAPYMIMELLVGADLEQILRARGPLPVADVADALVQACEAIAEAHALGIVHRDLKPANLFVAQRADGSPLVKVLDFGISKARSFDGSGIAQASMTGTSAMMGSPLYMSPEQMRSTRDVDHRTDIWSLGVILNELLTGQPAFDAHSIPDLCVKIATAEPVPLHARRPDAPAELDELIGKCLQKDPARRLPNVAEFALALLPFAPKGAKTSVERISRVIQKAGMSASALALPPSSDGDLAASQDAKTAASWGATSPRPKRRAVAFAAIAGAIVLLAAGVAIVVFRARASPAAVAPAAALVPVPATPVSEVAASASSTAPAPSGPSSAEAAASLAFPPAAPRAQAAAPPRASPTKPAEASSGAASPPPVTAPAPPPVTAPAPPPVAPPAATSPPAKRGGELLDDQK